MGPYQYKTRVLKCGVFSSFKTTEEMIQEEIDHHIADGWELVHIHPVHGAIAWYGTLIVFRKPAQAES